MNPDKFRTSVEALGFKDFEYTGHPYGFQCSYNGDMVRWATLGPSLSDSAEGCLEWLAGLVRPG